jgi:protein-disulfide isomerase
MSPFLAISLLLVVAGCSTAPTDSDGGSEARTVVATVGGQEITREQVEERIRGRLVELDIERYEAIKEGLDDLVDEMLLAGEAKARNLSVDALLDAEVSSKIAAPTDADIQRFYAENQSQLGGQSIDDLRQSIELYLRQQRNSEQRDTFVEGLRQARGVTQLLKPPTIPVRAEGPTRGPADAPVTIVEFSDYECPFCSRAESVVEQVMQTYGDKVRLVYRDYPLDMHPNARIASEAASCAHAQGKFWEYHAKLFANQRALGEEKLKVYADEVGLDRAKFDECLRTKPFRAAIDKDLADGAKAGVNGTPAFFINGRMLSGAQPFEKFREVIDEELASANG